MKRNAPETGDQGMLQFEAEQLGRRLALVGLTSSLTHKLGTPLHVIAGRTALLDDAEDLDEAKMHARAVAAQCRKMTEHLRLVQGTLEPPGRTLAVVSPGELLEGVISRVASVLDASSVDVCLSRNLPTEPFRLCAAQLQQAVTEAVILLIAPLRGATSVSIAAAIDERNDARPSPLGLSTRELSIRIRLEGGEIDAETLALGNEPWFAEGASQQQKEAALRWLVVRQLLRENRARMDVPGPGELVVSWPEGGDPP